MEADKLNKGVESSGLERRDFIRLAGTIALSTAVMDVSSHAYAGLSNMGDRESTFKNVSRINLDLKKPSTISVSADERIFVAGEDVILELDAQGREVSWYPIDGRPNSLIYDTDGRFLLGFREHAALFDANDALLKVWPGFDERTHITSMAADEQNVFVADAGNRVVLRFDKSGKLLNRIGERNREKDVPGLTVPSPYFDVALDPMGALWVVNPGKHGLECYRPDGSLITSWYRTGIDTAGFCGCCNPTHIAFLSNHSLVTNEKGLNRVKVLRPDHTPHSVLMGPASGLGVKFDYYCREAPAIGGIAVTADDRILLLNVPEACIQVYVEEKGPVHI